MVEAGADEVTEEDMLAAMAFAQEAIAAFCDKQQSFIDRVNPTPMDYTVHEIDPVIKERIEPFFSEMEAALHDADKLSRIEKVETLKDRITEEEFMVRLQNVRFCRSSPPKMISRMRSASYPRFLSPTALLPWHPLVAPRSRSWTQAFRSSVPYQALLWV